MQHDRTAVRNSHNTAARMAVYLVEELVDELVHKDHFRDLSMGLGRDHVIVYSQVRVFKYELPADCHVNRFACIL